MKKAPFRSPFFIVVAIVIILFGGIIVGLLLFNNSQNPEVNDIIYGEYEGTGCSINIKASGEYEAIGTVSDESYWLCKFLSENPSGSFETKTFEQAEDTLAKLTLESEKSNTETMCLYIRRDPKNFLTYIHSCDSVLETDRLIKSLNESLGFSVYLTVDDFELYDALCLDYENYACEKYFQQVELGEILFTENDIVDYNWDTQVITLNEQGSNYMSTLSLMDEHFVVMLGDDRMYGGKIKELYSAEALSYPVMYIDDRNPESIEILIKSESVLLPKELDEIKEHFSEINKLI